MTQVVTHRGLDPSRAAYFPESSYAAFEDQLLRGFGLEIDVRFTKDDRIVVMHDATLARTTGGTDTSRVCDLTLAELLARTSSSVHLASLEEVLSLFFTTSKRPSLRGAYLAIHVKHTEQTHEKLDMLTTSLDAFSSNFAHVFLFDLTPLAAAYVKERHPHLKLGASVAHLYDVERYGAATGGTLLTLEDIIAHKHLFSWAWLDEWDTRASDGGTKKFYTSTVFKKLRTHGFKIGLVTPELHASSPGLLGGESHKDAEHKDTLLARCKEIVALAPDVICTDYPDAVRELIPVKKNTPRSFSVRALFSPLLKTVVASFENYLAQFVTFHTRPMWAADMGSWRAEEVPGAVRVAIVIQGPIATEKHFTRETIRLYKSMFNNPIIVLSTWAGEHDAYIATHIAPENIDIIQNEKPPYAGPTNINFQIASTQSGIERAKALGAEYVMKTRADQRVYEKNSMEFLINTLAHFPASARSHQTKRLAFVHGLPKFAPYQFADLWMFGHIDDMREYWSVPHVHKGTESPFFVAEVYLATSYLTKKGWYLTWTTEQLFEIYRESVVPIDWYMLDLYWLKYEKHREHRDRHEYVLTNPRSDLLRYSEWFNLMSNPDKKPPALTHTFFFRGRIPLLTDQTK
jgi:glycerophosphoryl diester phosphodiesterase